jgi:gamma-glutamyltranspeptidase / glutathione hydrolase
VPDRGLLNATYVGLRGAPITPTVRLTPNPVAGKANDYQTASIDNGQRFASAAIVNGPGETTTHLSVVDKHGNMVSYTNTIESSHGIGVFAGYSKPDGSFKSHGFLLNNELTDFNLAPTTNTITGEAGYNDVQANKRPRSSMTPAMIFTPDGKPLVAYGSPGGSTIINSVLNVTLNLIDHGMTIENAIKAPRMSVTSAGTGNPNGPFVTTIAIENGFAPTTLDALRARGYTIGTPADIGSVQAVVVEPTTGKQYGAADARREGTVIGLPRPRSN